MLLKLKMPLILKRDQIEYQNFTVVAMPVLWDLCCDACFVGPLLPVL